MTALARSGWGAAPLTVRLFPLFMLMLLCSSLAILYLQEQLPSPELLAAAVSIDLTVTLSLAWFLMVAKPLRLPVASTLLFFVATVITAELLLPAGSQSALGWISLLAVPVELWLVWQGIAGVRRFRARLAALRGSIHSQPDMLDAYRASMQEVAGRGLFAEILASEMAMFHYAFSRVRDKDRPEPGTGLFTYHNKCDYLGLVLAISIIVMFEMVAVHLLVHHYWGAAPAWILTALSAYGFLWLRADSVASTRRLIEVDAEGLTLRCGLRWTARLEWNEIAGLEALPAAGHPSQNGLRMVLAGEPNCRLHLGKPAIVKGMFGLKREAMSLLLAIDDLPAFEAALGSHIEVRSAG